MGVLFYKSGQYDEAFTCYEQALREFPMVPKIWINSGIVFAALNLHDRAELAYAAAKRLDPRLNGQKLEFQE
jgi:tetratricopeptide (TPR) repeat protein